MNSVTIKLVTGAAVPSTAALNVPLGFIPDHVEVSHLTGNLTFSWWGTAHTATMVLNSAGQSAITAGGISAFTGSTASAPGITLGTAITVASAIQIGIKATRNIDGAA